MFLARLIGELWWIPGAAAFVAIGAAFAFAQPYLGGDTTPLENAALRHSAEVFEQKQGVSGIPVSVEDVSGTTSQANAYAVGFGPSRRVVLWSTMVDGSVLGRRRFASSSPTRSAITRATTFRRGSPGSLSSPCLEPGS